MGATLCVKMEDNKTILESLDKEGKENREFIFDYSFWSHDVFKKFI